MSNEQIYENKTIKEFNEYMSNILNILNGLDFYYKEGSKCELCFDVHEDYDGADLIIGRPFQYDDYVDYHKFTTNNKALIMRMLNNQINFLDIYKVGKYKEKYILLKAFLAWLDDNKINYSLYFKEKIIAGEDMFSFFKLFLYDNTIADIMKYISKENKERLEKYKK